MKIIVGNFKANGNLAYYKSIDKRLKDMQMRDTKLILCPPFVYQHILKDYVRAGQDVSTCTNTGNITADMLSDCGIEYCIINHIENKKTLFSARNFGKT